MKLSRSACVVAILSGLGGCALTDNHHGGVGGGIPTGAPISDIKVGAAVTLSPGSQAGYGITVGSGFAYRIVWTGDAGSSGTYREFWGSIWTSGTFTEVIPGCTNGLCALESDDYVSPVIDLPGGGQRIDWDTFATTGLDGLDFNVSTEPVYFDAFIDGSRYPQLVFFTDQASGDQVSPETLPFGLVSTTAQ